MIGLLHLGASEGDPVPDTYNDQDFPDFLGLMYCNETIFADDTSGLNPPFGVFTNNFDGLIYYINAAEVNNPFARAFASFNPATKQMYVSSSSHYIIIDMTTRQVIERGES